MLRDKDFKSRSWKLTLLTSMVIMVLAFCGHLFKNICNEIFIPTIPRGGYRTKKRQFTINSTRRNRLQSVSPQNQELLKIFNLVPKLKMFFTGLV